MIAKNDDFYNNLINVVKKLGEKEIVVIAGYFNGHVEGNLECYEEIMITELETRKGNGFMRFVQL